MHQKPKNPASQGDGGASEDDPAGELINLETTPNRSTLQPPGGRAWTLDANLLVVSFVILGVSA